jgi:hypothetical protein
MNKLNIKLILIILIPLLLLGGVGFFFYRMDAEIRATRAEVAAMQAAMNQNFSMTSTSSPLIQLGQGILSNMAQLNMNLVNQVKATPSPEK